MAYGVEIIIGFTHDQFKEVEQALGLQIVLDEDEIYGVQNMNQTLRELHRKLIEDLEFQLVEEERLFKVHTPKGLRHLSPLSFELYYDSYEDEKEDACVGVSLSSRYAPTLLDWRHQHGGSHGMALKKEEIDLIEKVKQKLITNYPIFNESSLIVKLQHY